MNKAYVFQHDTTGVQIFVYHCENKKLAEMKFCTIVSDFRSWTFIGLKTAQSCDH